MPFAVLCAAVLVGCGDARLTAGSSGYAVDTVGGVVVVTNAPAGRWSPDDAWRVREEFRIGRPLGSPEESFSGPLVSVSLGPHGHVYVLDQQAHDVTVFDGSGAFLRRFGGPGEGPGELHGPQGMGWDRQDRLWVPQGFTRGRYTIFDSTGALVGTTVREMGTAPRFQRPLHFFEDGTFVDEGWQGRGSLDAAMLLRIDTAGRPVDTLARLWFPEYTRRAVPPRRLLQAARFFPRLTWTLAPDGTVWSAETGELRLIQQTLEGDTLRVVETRHRSPSLTAEQERIIDQDLRAAGFDRSDVTVVRPIVQAIHALDDGHLLVQIVEEVGEDSEVVDVFDPDGRFLGTLRLGFAMSSRGIPALVGDTIIAAATGPLDVPQVVRATLLRPGDGAR